MKSIRELNEQMEEVLSEEIINRGKTIKGNPWTEDKIGEKEVEILGVTLKYNIVKFHVDMPEDERTFSDSDRVEYQLVNEEACDELEKVIKDLIHNTLTNDSSATKVKGGSTRMIGIPKHGYILD